MVHAGHCVGGAEQDEGDHLLWLFPPSSMDGPAEDISLFCVSALPPAGGDINGTVIQVEGHPREHKAFPKCELPSILMSNFSGGRHMLVAVARGSLWLLFFWRRGVGRMLGV